MSYVWFLKVENFAGTNINARLPVYVVSTWFELKKKGDKPQLILNRMVVSNLLTKYLKFMKE